MSPWTSESVALALGVPTPGRLAFTDVTTDTRHLKPGALFVALKGDRFDAHDFLADARTRGAAAAVVRRGTPRLDGLPVFEVADTLTALGLLARARRQRLPQGSPVVAITGSSGKTSTKEMIRAVLATRYRTHATSGNLNNLVGVPLTILAAPDDAEALVAEAGASVPGEIARLRDVIEPTIAAITNVGYAHVEGFGALGGVLREKVALVDGAGVAVVGTDPPELAREARRRTRTVVAGTAPEADVRPEAADLDDAGHPRITWGGGHSVTVPVLGFHQIENALLALAVGREAGVDPGRASSRRPMPQRWVRSSRPRSGATRSCCSRRRAGSRWSGCSRSSPNGHEPKEGVACSITCWRRSRSSTFCSISSTTSPSAPRAPR